MPDPTARWFKRARIACEPFMFAEARYRTPWVDDEFADVIRVARRWLVDNPSPDGALGQTFMGMLDAYNEMTTARVSRVMELRGLIEHYVRALDKWKPPSSRSAASVDVEPAGWDDFEASVKVSSQSRQG